jgi:hypothetical protein
VERLVNGRSHAYDSQRCGVGPNLGIPIGAETPAVYPGKGFPIRRSGVVFSLLGVLGIALILFVVVAATAGVVLGK